MSFSKPYTLNARKFFFQHKTSNRASKIFERPKEKKTKNARARSFFFIFTLSLSVCVCVSVEARVFVRVCLRVVKYSFLNAQKERKRERF